VPCVVCTAKAPDAILRQRISKDMAFANIQRSLKVVEEVWQRYEDGGAWVDWLDVVSEFDWELFVV
jgi:hypothetical protein